MQRVPIKTGEIIERKTSLFRFSRVQLNLDPLLRCGGSSKREDPAREREISTEFRLPVIDGIPTIRKKMFICLSKNGMKVDESPIRFAEDCRRLWNLKVAPKTSNDKAMAVDGCEPVYHQWPHRRKKPNNSEERIQMMTMLLMANEKFATLRVLKRKSLCTNTCLVLWTFHTSSRSLFSLLVRIFFFSFYLVFR
jgi:hypothetical protein